MIIVNRYFEIVTPESAEDCDAAERGILAEGERLTLRELIRAMQGGESSCYPARGDVFEWVSIPQGGTRAYFEDGEEETHTVHFSRDNPPRNARYWRIAMIAAGIVKPAAQGGVPCSR